MKNIVVIECAHLSNNGVVNIDGSNSILLMIKPLATQTSDIRVIAQHADSSLEMSSVLTINENGFVEFEMPFSWYDTAEVLTVQLTGSLVSSDPITMTIEDSLTSSDDYKVSMDGYNFTVKKVIVEEDPTIPTKTSDLINDSNFVSDASYHHTDVNFTDTLKTKLDGIDEGATHLFYGTCDTAAATAAKVATVSGNFTLVAGRQIAIKFTNANGKANPTLNVNGSGAISIKRYGTTAPSTSAASSWNAGSVVLLTYDGTYWQINNWLNSTYSAASVAEIESSSSTTARLITGQRFKQAFDYYYDQYMAITRGYPTNTTNTYYRLNGVAGSHYYYVKIGKIVFVNFNVQCVSAVKWDAHPDTFCTGLPAPDSSKEVYVDLACADVGSDSITLAIQGDGTVKASGGTTNKYYYGSVTYIAAS